MFLVCNYSLIQKQYQPRLGSRADEKLKPAQNRPLWNFHVVVGAWFLAPISGGFFRAFVWLAGEARIWNSEQSGQTWEIWSGILLEWFGSWGGLVLFHIEANLMLSRILLWQYQIWLEQRQRFFEEELGDIHKNGEKNTIAPKQTLSLQLCEKRFEGEVSFAARSPKNPQESPGATWNNLQLVGQNLGVSQTSPLQVFLLAIMVCCSLSTCPPTWLFVHAFCVIFRDLALP